MLVPGTHFTSCWNTFINTSTEQVQVAQAWRQRGVRGLAEKEAYRESSGDSWSEVWWGARGLVERVYRGEFRWLMVRGVVRCERPCRESVQRSSVDSQPEVWWGARGLARGREHTVGRQSPGEQPGGTGRPAGCRWGLAVPPGRSSPCTSPGNPAMIGEQVITLHHVPAQETLQWLVKISWNDCWKQCHHSSLCTSTRNLAIIGENNVITLYHLPAQESQWKTSHHTVSLHFAADLKHTTLHKANIFNRQTCHQWLRWVAFPKKSLYSSYITKLNS